MSVTILDKVGKSTTTLNSYIKNNRQDVLAVQKLLNVSQQQKSIPRTKLVEDGLIGPNTCGAISEFQQSMFGWKDGIVEPSGETLRKLNEIAGGQLAAGAPGNWAEKAVLVALTQDGVREQPLGSNNGPKVSEYLRSVGITHADLWCMAFVYWCFQQGAGKAGTMNTLKKTASCTELYSWAKSNGKLASTPQRGDIFLVRGGAAGRTHHHTGIVTSVSGGTVKTVEGNTNNDGSSNGIGVFQRSRSAGNLDYVRV